MVAGEGRGERQYSSSPTLSQRERGPAERFPRGRGDCRVAPPKPVGASHRTLLVRCAGGALARWSTMPRRARKVFCEGFRLHGAMIRGRLPLSEIFHDRVGKWLADHGVKVHLNAGSASRRDCARRRGGAGRWHATEFDSTSLPCLGETCGAIAEPRRCRVLENVERMSLRRSPPASLVRPPHCSVDPCRPGRQAWPAGVFRQSAATGGRGSSAINDRGFILPHTIVVVIVLRIGCLERSTMLLTEVRRELKRSVGGPPAAVCRGGS